MTERSRMFAPAVFCAYELLLTAAAFFLALFLRQEFSLEALKEDFEWRAVMPLLPAALILWVPILWRFGLPRMNRTDGIGGHVLNVAKIVFLGGLALLAFSFGIQKFNISRAFLGLFAGTNFLVLLANRSIATVILRHARERGYDRVYVLLVGTGKMARRHAALLEEHREWGIEIVGLVAERGDLKLDTVAGHQVLGSVEDLPRIVQSNVVDELHVAVSRSSVDLLDGAIRFCDEVGVRVRIVMSYFEEMNSRLAMDYLGGIPLLTFSSTPKNELALVVKRVMDIGVSLAGLALASPILLVSAIAIALESRGPIVFQQRRAGMNGRTFTLYKFRTMVEDAEAIRADLESRNEMDGPVFKMKDDPRVTRVGRVLRKLSLDELPQLWNVLRGDMSIVGPRPPIPSEVDRYERWQRRRLSMRPGITCLWQINGRNTVDFERWMQMDLSYIDNWSLGLDFKIILKTIPAVFSMRGAS